MIDDLHKNLSEVVTSQKRILEINLTSTLASVNFRLKDDEGSEGTSQNVDDVSNENSPDRFVNKIVENERNDQC